MGRRGPQPATAAELLARGNVKLARTRLASAATAARPGVPDPPDALSPAARRAWTELVAVLDARGQTSPDWRQALAVLATTIALANETYARLSEALAGDVDTRNVRKLTGLHARASADVLRWLKLFALTPESAAKLGVSVSPEPRANPRARFFIRTQTAKSADRRAPLEKPAGAPPKGGECKPRKGYA